jgi:hypothetical protein
MKLSKSILSIAFLAMSAVTADMTAVDRAVRAFYHPSSFRFHSSRPWFATTRPPFDGTESDSFGLIMV